MVYEQTPSVWVDWREDLDCICNDIQRKHAKDFSFDYIEEGPPERVRILNVKNKKSFEHIFYKKKDTCCPTFFAALNGFFEGNLYFYAFKHSTGSDTWVYVGQEAEVWISLKAALGKTFKKVFYDVGEI